MAKFAYRRGQPQRMSIHEVGHMLKEAGVIKDPRYEIGIGKSGTITHNGPVAFRGEDNLYDRDEVRRYIVGHREGQRG